MVAEVGYPVPTSNESDYFHYPYEPRDQATRLGHVQLAWRMNGRPQSLDTRGPIFQGEGERGKATDANRTHSLPWIGDSINYDATFASANTRRVVEPWRGQGW